MKDTRAKDVQEFFERVATDWDTMRLAYYEAWRERCPIYLALTKAMDVSLNTETTQA
jgi:hypothetical protein